MSIYQSTKVSPYVYWLTHKTTGQFYIGYREANLVPSNQDLPIYKTSSDKVDELGFENFDFQIVAEFFDGDSAYDFENRTIEVNIKNPLCLNKFFMKDGQKKFRRTGPHTEETKIKMSNSGMGKIISNKTRIKLSIANSGDNCSMELRAFRSALKKGKVVSNETRIRSSIAREQFLNKLTSENRKEIFATRTGTIHSDETKIKISNSVSGNKNPRSKKWLLIRELDESTIIVDSLKPWCESMQIAYSSLRKTIKSNKFHKGYKIIGS